MPEVDVRNWGENAAANPMAAWQQVTSELLSLGLGNAYYIFDYPLFTSGFPDREKILGVMVCREFEQTCGDSRLGELGWDQPNPMIPGTASVGRRVSYQPARILKRWPVSKQQRETLSMALDYGVNAGHTFPIVDRNTRTFSMMLIDGVDSAKDYSSLIELHSSQLWRGAIYFHEGMMVRQLVDNAGRNPLSPREQDCLAWTSAGRSAKQIADTLHLAECTVNEYLRSACKKLGASNKTQATARATLLQFVNP